jgi:hypothetical protein
VTAPEYIDLERHPISDPAYVAGCRRRLESTGALVLDGFLTHSAVDAILGENEGREGDAFFTNDTHNVYLTPPDSELAPDHVFNRQIVSTKGCLADDQVPANSPLRALYDSPELRGFLSDILDVDGLHPYDDELSSINVHFHRDGEELGWHFDNSSFAVTLLIQAPEAGGRFEYVSDLRDADAGDLNLGEVEAVLDTANGVEVLDFEPGALVVFRGRNSMHRVTPSRGHRTRILVVFAYNTEPDIGLSAQAQETFYGRVG